MTEFEAVQVIQDILDEATADDNAVCYVTKEDAEALEMAIKALKIKALRTAVKALKKKNDKKDSIDNFDEIYKEYLEDDYINHLPD